MVNKVDRSLLELMLDAESMYQNFSRIIENVNVIISTYQGEESDLGNIMVYPNVGNVAFGSGLQQWGFTLSKFAQIYSTKFKIDKAKMMEKLWGDNFFDKAGKKWKKVNQGDDGSVLKRAFVEFVMEPIQKLAQEVINGNKERYEKMLERLEIHLTSEQKTLEGKKLMKAIMQKWMNAADALLEMIICHLPSPKAAQKYRTNYLYEGPQDDECSLAMKNCDPNGPLMLYVSKMVPTSDKGRFFAFGRVFSGTVSTGQKVRIMGPNYTPGKKEDLFCKSI